jgi:hypothetical protein
LWVGAAHCSMGGCRIGGDGAWCCQSVTVNGTDLGLLPPAGRSFALRCGRPGYNCARSSILWGTFAAGPCCPALHSRGCTVRKTGRRDCVTAPASSWPSSRRDGGRSCLHAATRTPPAAGTAPRRGLAMHMHGCAVASARHIGAYYAVRCPHHTTAPSHRAKRRWPTLIALRPRKNRSMQLCFHSTSYGH